MASSPVNGARLASLRKLLASLPPRAAWTFAGVVHSVGWAGVAGILLMVAGAAGLVYSGAWLEPALDRERTAVAEAARQSKALPAPAADVRPPPSARLDQFHAEFPAVAEIPVAIGAVLKIATGHGMSLDQGQYRLVGDPGGPMMRYQITLPVRGSYRQLRAFVEQALAELPALALDGVEFRREAVGAAQLESVVEFSLYVHPR